MKIDVKKVAHLARLNLTPDEESKFSSQLAGILGHFESISKIKTDNVEPLVTPSPMKAVLREDQVAPSISVEKAVANAPSAQGHLFKVPPVVG